MAGKGLTKIGRICIDSLNEMARLDAADEPLPNHTPSAPAFWFRGLAAEQGGRVFLADGIRSHLSDEAVVLMRDVLRCSCDYKWGTWQAGYPDALKDGQPFSCYACAFDAHAMCIHGCQADHEVLAALDGELTARNLPAYELPQYDAQQKSSFTVQAA